MGLLSKIVAAKVTTKIVEKLNQKARDPAPSGTVRTAPRQEYLPANPNLADRAINVYRQNPKLIGGLGVLAAAMVLTQMKRR